MKRIVIFCFVCLSSLLISGVMPGQQGGGDGWCVAFGSTKRGCIGIAIALGVYSLFVSPI